MSRKKFIFLNLFLIDFSENIEGKSSKLLFSLLLLEAPPRFELGHKGFADLCLTAWLWCHIKKWSGLRGSNPLPPPWQGGALPDELNPHKWCLRTESNHRHEDFQSSALPTELQRQKKMATRNGIEPSTSSVTG